MIQMHGTPDRARIYGDIADRMERDPISEDLGRATVPMGRGFKRWTRFYGEADLTWVQTPDGKMVGLTPWQNKVYQRAVTFIDNGTITIRGLAVMLGCAPSTVSRALVKLMAWGLLGTITGKGRYAGMVIFSMTNDGTFQRLRDAAKAKVRAWSQAAQQRLSRLQANVAPYALEGERGVDSLYYYLTSISITKGATLKAAWTADDLAGIV